MVKSYKTMEMDIAKILTKKYGMSLSAAKSFSKSAVARHKFEKIRKTKRYKKKYL